MWQLWTLLTVAVIGAAAVALLTQPEPEDGDNDSLD
jgi:hypothetical protein